MVDTVNIGTLSPILRGELLKTRAFFRGNPTRDPVIRDPRHRVPEVPTNNDIAVRNLLGSTTALHLEHSVHLLHKNVPDEDVGLSENVGYIPNEIAIFHRDDDH